MSDDLHAFMMATSATAWMKDVDGRYVWVNRAWETIAGLTSSAAVGKTTHQLFGHSVADGLDPGDRAVLATGKLLQTLETLPDGRTLQAVRFLFLDRHGDRFLGGMAFDVTREQRAASDLQRLQERLRQTQKMEAIGRLAGGVAHDFNNLLTVIGSCAETLLARVQNDPRSIEEVQQISFAVERAANLTRQLLTLGRNDKTGVRPLSLSAELVSIAPLARRLAAPTAELSIDVQPDLPKVLGNPGELSQVVINLVANARDAIAETGTIVVGARRAPEGPVVLFVRDTGSGMDELTRQRALEPFFTTKEPGKGTGLGLASVFGIVSRWGGSVTLDSALGKGTTVSIALRPVPEGKPSPARLLLVDDDELVRRATRMMLEQQGHHVTTASGGEAALELLRGDAPCDLLITDVRMPGMSGSELAEHALALRPTLKVLAISGHAHSAFAGALALPILQKPYTYEDLDAEVRSLLRR